MSSPREVPQVWAGPREAVVGRWWGLFSRFGCWIRKIHSFSGLVDTFEFRGQEVGTLSLPVAFAFDLDLVGVVGQTVKSALGKNRVIEQRNPLVERVDLMQSPFLCGEEALKRRRKHSCFNGI